MYEIAEKIETERLAHAEETNDSHKKEFGQYFTPFSIAKYMASLFPATNKSINILDPGAGIGALSCALLNRIATEKWNNPKIELSAYDLDSNVIYELKKNLLNEKENLFNFDFKIYNSDFLEKTSFEYTFGTNEQFSHIIMNPPYKKIQAKSSARKFSRCFGLETVNLYSAFIGAAIALLKQEGYLVAIVPRSFCNGLYYKPFRKFILDFCSIKKIHLFESRHDAFKDESVLQENIIIMLQRGTKQKNVEVSYSSDANFLNVQKQFFEFSSIVNENDKELYINIPIPGQKENVISYTKNANFISLKETGISVSTGTIVDFRVKDFIKKNPEKGTVPLLYPIHFRNYRLEWPKESKKPNAILCTKETENMFVPAGYYVVVKRFSTKEEKKRIVASLISSEDVNAESFAFENHLNVFHVDKKDLSKEIAYGLIVWLNTSYLDSQFRLFSGHTQVNATDLRNLPYPSNVQLEEMGAKLVEHNHWSQGIFDSISMECLNEKSTAANF
ncbi:MAG: N-6 DNA methylase [Treponema sp.]